MLVTSLRSRTIRPLSGILLLTSRFTKSEFSNVRLPRHFTTTASACVVICRLRPEVEMIAGSGMKFPSWKGTEPGFSPLSSATFYTSWENDLKGIPDQA
jgi:hypothetical protein